MLLIKVEPLKKKDTTPVEINYKQLHYSIPLLNLNLMLVLAEPVEMKKKQEPKNVSFLIEMSLANGIQKIKDLNYGIYLMAKKILANIFDVSQLATGQNLMYGNT